MFNLLLIDGSQPAHRSFQLGTHINVFVFNEFNLNSMPNDRNPSNEFELLFIIYVRKSNELNIAIEIKRVQAFCHRPAELSWTYNVHLN